MGRRLHVGGRVHIIGLSAPSSFENEVSGDLEDRAIFVSGEDVDEDNEPEAVDGADERRGVSGRVRLPDVVMMMGNTGENLSFPTGCKCPSGWIWRATDCALENHLPFVVSSLPRSSSLRLATLYPTGQIIMMESIDF